MNNEKRDDSRDNAKLICGTISLALKEAYRLVPVGKEQKTAIEQLCSFLEKARGEAQTYITERLLMQ